jgi:plastocyanin
MEAKLMTKMRVLHLFLALASAAAFAGGLAAAGSPATAGSQGAGRVDPRAGGFEVALGEWALSTEARAIRPGPVTFVISNRGKFRHGLELEIRGGDERDGGRRDDDAESIELRPGQVTRMTLNLAPGVYELECFVEDHDDMGMRGVLEVRENAPLVAPKPATTRSTVDIAGFVFKPATLRTTVGSTVTWRNSDSAPHTATAKQFSSPQLQKGASFRRRFTRAGTYAYICALHPAMRGRVIVASRAAK